MQIKQSLEDLRFEVQYIYFTASFINVTVLDMLKTY